MLIHLPTGRRELMKEKLTFNGCKHSENHTQRSKSIDSAFQNIMIFARNIEKLDLTNLEGKVMDEIMERKIKINT